MCCFSRQSDRSVASRIAHVAILVVFAGVLVHVAARRHSDAREVAGVMILVGAATTFLTGVARVISLRMAARREMLAALSISSRAHRLFKPSPVMLVTGWATLVLACLVQLISAAALGAFDSAEPKLGMAAMMFLIGMALLWRGLRRVTDYRLLHDAWLEATRRDWPTEPKDRQ